MYLTNDIYLRLQQAFIEKDLSINIRSDYIVVENSEDQAKKRISKIVKSVGFCPFIFKDKTDNKFAFTISPYRLPKFFSKNQSVSTIASAKICAERRDSAQYFSFDEVSSLLEAAKFFSKEESEDIEDPWLQINSCRSFVSSALNQALLDIISPYIKDKYPIVEIGSAIGYTLLESLSQKTIRIQPSITECKLLKKETNDPIYQLDIAGLYNSLIKSGKKIPLFFALNVFDVISPDKRKASLLQLSQLQNPRDRILMMLDTNPYLDVAIQQLEALYPKHAIFPYFPLTNEPAKFSFLIVPNQYVEYRPSQSELLDIIDYELMTIMNGNISQMRYDLHQLQSKFNLKVIDLEAFFIKQVSKELAQIGYKAKIYCHASFKIGDHPNNLLDIEQDLIYRSVTDTITVRQWSLTDKNLLNWLDKKGVNIPKHFDEIFLKDLREKRQKILGAEILVIEATKS